jgi:hypothetical protein
MVPQFADSYMPIKIPDAQVQLCSLHNLAVASLDQPIRPDEHLRRNRQADLLGRLQIEH